MPKPSPDGPKNFRVIQTQVGPWPKGFIVTPEQLAEHSADSKRLLDLKAIEPVEEPGTGKTPLVPDEMARQAATRPVVAPATRPVSATGAEPGSLKDAQAKGPVLP